MNVYLKFSLLLLFALLFITCNKDNVQKEDNDDNSTDTSVHEDATDYTWNAGDETLITFTATSVTTSSANASVSGTTATILHAGPYRITGTCNNGQIIVNTTDDEKVHLILDNLNLTSTVNAPVFVKDAKKVILYLSSGTTNDLTDAASYTGTTDDEPNAALYSKADLTVYGEGTLNITGNFADGITSKDGLIINSGNIVVKAADDGIRGKDYLIVENGQIQVTSGGDALEARTNATINSGNLTLKSGGGSSYTASSTLSAKGIKAKNQLIINDGTIAINSADDGIHSNSSVEINGGTITVSSGDDGIKSEVATVINDGSVSITKSYEGMESPAITVNSGEVKIVASDDGFNATKGNGGEANDGSLLTINGGEIYVNASGGDALDSNGSIAINGGTIAAHGPQSQPEVGMDYNGTCTDTGGILIITGPSTNMLQATSTSSTINCLKLIFTSTQAANTIFHIQDASGVNVVTFKPVRSYLTLVFSSALLKTGSTYYIYTGGSSNDINSSGISTGGNYTPGTLYGSFTVSSVITTVGNASSGGRP